MVYMTLRVTTLWWSANSRLGSSQKGMWWNSLITSSLATKPRKNYSRGPLSTTSTLLSIFMSSLRSWPPLTNSTKRSWLAWSSRGTRRWMMRSWRRTSSIGKSWMRTSKRLRSSWSSWKRMSAMETYLPLLEWPLSVLTNRTATTTFWNKAKHPLSWHYSSRLSV